MKVAVATEGSSDLHRLAYSAIRAANVSDEQRCFGILRYLKSLNLSVKDLGHSEVILPLESLRDHENPKIRMEANVLFNSWMKTLYFSGSDSSTRNKAPLPLKRKRVDCVQVSHDIAAEAKKKTKFLRQQEKEDERSRVHETGETKKIDGSKSSAARSLPMELPKNPRFEARETGETKQNLNKSGVCKSVLPTSRTTLQMKKKKPSLKVSETPNNCPALKKNSTEMLELFEIAKKSADVANAKGILAAKAETSICVDTLSLLMNFPISSTATETGRIMERLERLTKHKDRKICNSASALLHCWRENIKRSTTSRRP
ncbi:hypothetical protein CARUB_v10025031mg [Capsella rubella]|uniref:TFIIS N-terminal domain-containing protein n=1 Tax=Capsella rubella TaxID=81985 RepID=R0HGI5_9BRAS|nr:uncharacterized protein LOC17889444 [Capsella rubella]EOA28799.1 hypothetical protein CARUB_v10025031mg [Capsella rubella]